MKAPIREKQKRADNKWQIWRPFFAWRRGRSKDPITIGLTSEQGRLLLGLLSELPDGYGYSFAERSAVDALGRENLKPLADGERGAIYAESTEPTTIFNGRLSQSR